MIMYQDFIIPWTHQRNAIYYFPTQIWAISILYIFGENWLYNNCIVLKFELQFHMNKIW